MSRNEIFLERQAEEAGCWGLVGGCARNLVTNQEFYASSAEKADGPFYCPDCMSDAVLRKCTHKKDHFAHKSRLSPVVPMGEGKLHGDCKNTICRLLNSRFPDGKWEVERSIPPNEKLGIPELRPDVSGRMGGDIRVAIEIQASNLTVNKIVNRTKHYSKRNIALLWIVPLTKELGDDPFRPRQYERYLHSIYYGRTYYWWDGLDLDVMPVHYETATRYIDPAEWYEDGELKQVGDYEKPYKTIKKPGYSSALNIADDFELFKRSSFTPENERIAVPECVIWRDKLQAWW